METTLGNRRRALPPVPRAAPRADGAQQFVARLRAAAPEFAAAAGAESAVVPEVVPPARHRRARCRVVLRHADGDVDLTFLGAAGEPGSRHGFDREIGRWLSDGRPRDATWVVPDPLSAGGVAVDLTAWLAGTAAR